MGETVVRHPEVGGCGKPFSLLKRGSFCLPRFATQFLVRASTLTPISIARPAGQYCPRCPPYHCRCRREERRRKRMDRFLLLLLLLLLLCCLKKKYHLLASLPLVSPLHLQGTQRGHYGGHEGRGEVGGEVVVQGCKCMYKLVYILRMSCWAHQEEHQEAFTRGSRGRTAWKTARQIAAGCLAAWAV